MEAQPTQDNVTRRRVLQVTIGTDHPVPRVPQDTIVMEQAEEELHVRKNSIVDQGLQNQLIHLILLGHVPLDICVTQVPQTLGQEVLLHVLKITSVRGETQVQVDQTLQRPAQQLVRTL